MRSPYVNALLLGVMLVCVALAGGAADQKDKADADEPVYELGHGITPPTPTHREDPAYLPAVRVEGTVSVSLTVSSAGLPKDLRVVQGIDKDVDQSVVDALKQWRFDPARKDGKAVAVRITIEFHFHDM